MGLYNYECKQCGFNELHGGDIMHFCPDCKSSGLVMTKFNPLTSSMDKDDRKANDEQSDHGVKDLPNG